MRLHVDVDASTPPYEQIRAQLEGMIGAGRLSPDTRLPPVRQLATDLRLAPGTVARAYRELESAGLLVTRGRRGTFVVGADEVDVDTIRRQRLAGAAAAFADAARGLGVDADTAVAAVRDALTAPGTAE